MRGAVALARLRAEELYAEEDRAVNYRASNRASSWASSWGRGLVADVGPGGPTLALGWNGEGGGGGGGGGNRSSGASPMARLSRHWGSAHLKRNLAGRKAPATLRKPAKMNTSAPRPYGSTLTHEGAAVSEAI